MTIILDSNNFGGPLAYILPDYWTNRDPNRQNKNAFVPDFTYSFISILFPSLFFLSLSFHFLFFFPFPPFLHLKKTLFSKNNSNSPQVEMADPAFEWNTVDVYKTTTTYKIPKLGYPVVDGVITFLTEAKGSFCIYLFIYLLFIIVLF